MKQSLIYLGIVASCCETSASAGKESVGIPLAFDLSGSRLRAGLLGRFNHIFLKHLNDMVQELAKLDLSLRFPINEQLPIRLVRLLILILSVSPYGASDIRIRYLPIPFYVSEDCFRDEIDTEALRFIFKIKIVEFLGSSQPLKKLSRGLIDFSPISLVKSNTMVLFRIACSKDLRVGLMSCLLNLRVDSAPTPIVFTH